MLIFNDINWLYSGFKLDRVNRGMLAASLALIIDSQIVRIIIIDKEYKELFTNAKRFEESEFPIHKDRNLYPVKIIKESGEEELLVCDEMLYAILLSEPKIVHLTNRFKYYEILTEGWSYTNDEFIIPGVHE
jgi:hypothetical protein